MAPAPIMLATFLVGIFYSLDALYGERRERSILFWKSMPVSDRTTVLSKAAIPLLVLPLVAFVLCVIRSSPCWSRAPCSAGQRREPRHARAEVHFVQYSW
jgi:hypothetical protein